MITFLANDESDTVLLGKILADVLPAGTTVSLAGTLGAGKTRLVRAFASACGVDEEQVLSPTFVICHEYEADRFPIYHFDAYRISDDDEFLNLGVDEYFEAEGVAFVEWGERVVDCLPAERLEISIAILDDTKRQFEMRVTSDALNGLLEQIKSKLNVVMGRQPGG